MLSSTGIDNFLRWREQGRDRRWSLLPGRGFVPSLGLRTTFKLHTGCVNTAVFSPDGEFIISSGDDCRIAISKTNQSTGLDASKALISFDSGHEANVFSAKVVGSISTIESGTHIASCALDGDVRLHTILDGGSVRTKLLHSHEDAAHRIAVSPVNPSVFCSVGEDGRVKLYDLRSDRPGSVVHTFCLSEYDSTGADVPYPIFSAEFRPQAPTQLLIGGDDAIVRLFDLRYTPQRMTPAVHWCPHHMRASEGEGWNVTGVAWNWCGSRFVATYNYEHTYEFDVDGSPEPSTIYAPPRPLDLCDNAGEVAPQQDLPQGDDGGDSMFMCASDKLPPSSAAGESDASDADAAFDVGRSNAPRVAGQSRSPAHIALTRFNPDAPAVRHWWHTLPRATQTTMAPRKEEALGRGSYAQVFKGHRNHDTVKGVSYYGPRSEYVVQGCDSGSIFFYEAATGKVATVVYGDRHGAVNCLTPHPLGLPMLLTSGLETSFKLWAPVPDAPRVSRKRISRLVRATRRLRRFEFRVASSQLMAMANDHVGDSGDESWEGGVSGSDADELDDLDDDDEYTDDTDSDADIAGGSGDSSADDDGHGLGSEAEEATGDEDDSEGGNDDDSDSSGGDHAVIGGSAATTSEGSSDSAIDLCDSDEAEDDGYDLAASGESETSDSNITGGSSEDDSDSDSEDEVDSDEEGDSDDAGMSFAGQLRQAQIDALHAEVRQAAAPAGSREAGSDSGDNSDVGDGGSESSCTTTFSGLSGDTDPDTDGSGHLDDGSDAESSRAGVPDAAAAVK